MGIICRFCLHRIESFILQFYARDVRFESVYFLDLCIDRTGWMWEYVIRLSKTSIAQSASERNWTSTDRKHE